MASRGGTRRPLVADLLASTATLRVLATSRAPLRVRGEREYALGPLALDVDGEAASPADRTRAPALRLFVERARDVQPGFRLTAANGPTVSAICRGLDALPLAPWIKVLTAEDLLRRLTDDVLLSSIGARDLPERQQTINATVAWSYQLLSPHEQRMFRRLGVLPGRFPIQAAAAVLAGRDGSSCGSDDALQAQAGECQQYCIACRGRCLRTHAASSMVQDSTGRLSIPFLAARFTRRTAGASCFLLTN